MKKNKVLLFSLAILALPFMSACNKAMTTNDIQSQSEVLSVSADYAPSEITGDYHNFVEEYDGHEAERIIIRSNTALKDFKFIEVAQSTDNANVTFSEAAVLYEVDELSPEKPFVASWLEQGTVPHRGISFLDANNTRRYYYVTKSGEDGSIMLVEFKYTH